VIIANLFQVLKSAPTEKTYVFVAFDKEEKGLLGSAAMSKAIPRDQRQKYCAMVNFDSFGLAYPQVLTNTSSPKMSKFAREVAESVKMPYHEASLAGAADADSTSFLAKEIPAITFHGLSNDWRNYLHTSRDKVENIELSSVVRGLQFGLVYLTKLDPLPCNSFRK
jgi:Zn-dependent M28 family amino/carboxypeptidase